MKRYAIILFVSFLIINSGGTKDLNNWIPQKFKEMSKEQLIEILMKYAKSSEDKKRVPDGVWAWEEIIYSDRFSSDEKFSILKDYYYNECIYKPYRMRIGNSETDILKENIDNIVERFKKELKSKYAEEGCYRDKIIIALGYLGYGGREIGDEIIKIFDNPYGEFRVGAVEAFRIGGYIKYYTKEEMMPYIRKLAKDGYFTINTTDIRRGKPGEYCWNNEKFFPVRRALRLILDYYGVKYKFIKVDDCSNRTIELDE